MKDDLLNRIDRIAEALTESEWQDSDDVNDDFPGKPSPPSIDRAGAIKSLIAANQALKSVEHQFSDDVALARKTIGILRAQLETGRSNMADLSAFGVEVPMVQSRLRKKANLLADALKALMDAVRYYAKFATRGQ